MTFEEILPFFKKGAKIRLSLWEKGQYLRYDIETRNIVNDKDEDTDIMGCHISSNDWEIYTEPREKFDWQEIIKNKCLCWFWDNDEDAETKRIATFLYKKQDSTFIDIAGYCWRHCQPVKKPDFIFYKDKKINKKTIIDTLIKCTLIVPIIGFILSVAFEYNPAILFFLGTIVILEILLAISFFIDD